LELQHCNAATAATENAVQKVAQWAKVNGRNFALVEYQDQTPVSARMVPRRCSVAVLQFKSTRDVPARSTAYVPLHRQPTTSGAGKVQYEYKHSDFPS
jgi:hypothetical protein